MWKEEGYKGEEGEGRRDGREKRRQDEEEKRRGARSKKRWERDAKTKTVNHHTLNTSTYR